MNRQNKTGLRALPALMLFVADFEADVGHYRLEEVGLWTLLLCIMSKSMPRGFLLVNGERLSEENLARRVRTGLPRLRRLLGRMKALYSVVGDEPANDSERELQEHAVRLGVPGGILFSRRMVRDEIRRQKSSEYGKRGGGNPALRFRTPPAPVAVAAPPAVVPRAEVVPPAAPVDPDEFWKKVLSDTELHLLKYLPTLRRFDASYELVQQILRRCIARRKQWEGMMPWVNRAAAKYPPQAVNGALERLFDKVDKGQPPENYIAYATSILEKPDVTERELIREKKLRDVGVSKVGDVLSRISVDRKEPQK